MPRMPRMPLQILALTLLAIFSITSGSNHGPPGNGPPGPPGNGPPGPPGNGPPGPGGDGPPGPGGDGPPGPGGDGTPGPIGPWEPCCRKKEVDGHVYLLKRRVKDEELSEYQCQNGCIYWKWKDQDKDALYCFKRGGFSSICLEETDSNYTKDPNYTQKPNYTKEPNGGNGGEDGTCNSGDACKGCGIISSNGYCCADNCNVNGVSVTQSGPITLCKCTGSNIISAEDTKAPDTKTTKASEDTKAPDTKTTKASETGMTQASYSEACNTGDACKGCSISQQSSNGVTTTYCCVDGCKENAVT